MPEPKPDSEDEDVVMTEADIEKNATLFLENICDETGSLKEKIAEEAKDWMEHYLRKKRNRSV